MENTQITEEAIRQAESVIRAVVGQLTSKGSVRSSDGEDVAQILRAHVAQRAPQHNPRIASLKTFIEQIVENKVRDVIREQHAQCRDQRKTTRSLDEPVIGEDGEEGVYGDTLDSEAAMRRDGMLPWEADAALLLDVKLVLEELSGIDQLTCQALGVTKSLREAAERLGVHVETLRQRIGKIRNAFEMRGIVGV